MGDHSSSHHCHDRDRDGDHDRRHRSATDLYGIINVSWKAYRSLVKKWCSDHKHSPKKNQKDRGDVDKTPSRKVREDKLKKGEKQDRLRADDNEFSCLLRSSSRRSHTPTPGPTYLSKSPCRSSSKSSLLRTFSRKSRTEDDTSQLQQDEKKQTKRSSSVSRVFSLSRSRSRKSTSETEKPKLSKSTSRRSTTPLVFSQSIARRKPPPIEKTLECTLEELCFGAVKKINIVKDVISYQGVIVKQEDTLTVNIKPGWTKGTKVTFEGKGDENPGYLPADIIFSVQEKRHHLFKRTGDDLEIVVEIPLVKALTGCQLAVPLLGGDTMSIHVNDIVYPGYEKVIQGQGMPNAEGGNRGDLRITFVVKFPTNLSNEQRSEACSILEGCS
ncbi:Kinase superfamily protein isoform 1 [Hibiscus syriacus]|uniref:Kinase superfamily protein isoform 1 n=1 Tax=Hibiscus syriacus TaxID=106335 RepID=A0A6A2XTI8_HIBSY|nr:dnaJ protein homolog [Hibiscus syriacus]KAE8680021.1 Kinase superfamily protein isoform 1 [Hibiscus syriacus]